MMPVSDDTSAPVQERAGSSDRASAAADQPQALDAVAQTLRVDAFHLHLFGGVGRDNQLFAFTVRHAMRCTIRV